MNNLMEKPTANATSATMGMAVSRALAKARVGDAQALRWLLDQRTAGNFAAGRAVEEFQRSHGVPATTN